jgi:hypothetical protein
MNSLLELNGLSETSLTYTDDRYAKIVFDRPEATDQLKYVGTGQSHNMSFGIDITEIVKPDELDIYFEVDVSAASGANVVWNNLASGLVYSNPSTGHYRISNIDTVEQWTTVKDATVNLAALYNTSFSYTATIYYNPSKTKSFSVNVVVTTVANLSSVFTMAPVKLSGIQGSVVKLNSAFTVNAIGLKIKSSGFTSTMSSATALTCNVYQFTKATATISSISSVSAHITRIRPLLSNMSSVCSVSAIAKRFRGPVNVPILSIATLRTGIDGVDLMFEIEVDNANHRTLSYAISSYGTIDIDWGDGSTSIFSGTSIKNHTYSQTGNYIIRISNRPAVGNQPFQYLKTISDQNYNNEYYTKRIVYFGKTIEECNLSGPKLISVNKQLPRSLYFITLSNSTSLNDSNISPHIEKFNSYNFWLGIY